MSVALSAGRRARARIQSYLAHVYPACNQYQFIITAENESHGKATIDTFYEMISWIHHSVTLLLGARVDAGKVILVDWTPLRRPPPCSCPRVPPACTTCNPSRSSRQGPGAGLLDGLSAYPPHNFFLP